MDNGRIRIEPYRDALLCEVYFDGELTLDDVKWAIETVRQSFILPIDVIVKRTGSYSVSSEAQRFLRGGLRDIGRIVFVADVKAKRLGAEHAQSTYLRSQGVGVFETIDEAYASLKTDLPD